MGITALYPRLNTMAFARLLVVIATVEYQAVVSTANRKTAVKKSDILAQAPARDRIVPLG
jgi:hypothetical protein